MRRKQAGTPTQLPLPWAAADNEALKLPEPLHHDLVETLADLLLAAAEAGTRDKTEGADEPEART